VDGEVGSIRSRLRSRTKFMWSPAAVAIQQRVEQGWLVDSETERRMNYSLHKLTAAIAACSAGSSRLEFTQEMQGRWRWGALKEQTKCRIFAVTKHRQITEVLKGILRHVQSPGFKVCSQREVHLLGKSGLESIRYPGTSFIPSS
jgi:hypothetical protein